MTGAIGGAALALPLPEALAAVRRRQPRESVHCLPLPDRFRPGEILPDCSFASFSPDGVRVALATPRGIEILNRDDGTRVTATGPGFTLNTGAWHPAGTTLIASGPAEDGSGPYLYAISTAGVTRLLGGHPGAARAASFSPDGAKVAFTYLNRYQHQICMADWSGTELAEPAPAAPGESLHRVECRPGDVRALLERDARLQPRWPAALLRVRPRGGDAQREHPLPQPRERQAAACHLRRGCGGGDRAVAGRAGGLHGHHTRARPRLPHDGDRPRRSAIPRVRRDAHAARHARREAARSDREWRRAQDGLDIRASSADRRQPKGPRQEAERPCRRWHVPPRHLLDVARRDRARGRDALCRRIERAPARTARAQRPAGRAGPARRRDPRAPSRSRRIRSCHSSAWSNRRGVGASG